MNDPSMIRLQKYIAECGMASRRQAEEYIREGRVTVNNRRAELGQSIDPAKDIVVLDGDRVVAENKIYVLLNKPPDVVTTAHDTHGRTTVMHCTKGVTARVFPVGRLDMDVTGVLLLTNDGELANRLIHPKYGVQKTYTAWVKGRVNDRSLQELREGIQMEEGDTAAPAEVSIVDTRSDQSLLRMVLREGRKREVKRMCAAIGHPVLNLRRTTFANLSVSNMRVGEWRYLNEREIQMLKKLAGM